MQQTIQYRGCKIHVELVRQVSRCAGRTRTAAKREESAALVPSRQVTVCQATYLTGFIPPFPQTLTTRS